MPKKNKYKNRFKSVGSSSLTPGQSSQVQPQAQASLAPRQSSQLHLLQSSHHRFNLRLKVHLIEPVFHSIPSSSSDGVSSQSVIPSASNGSKPTKHKDDEDDRNWLVDVIGAGIWMG